MSGAVWMSAAEFDAELETLAGPLRERVLALRPYVLGRRIDAGVAEAVRHAFYAVYAGDEAAAAVEVGRAEARAAELAAAAPGDAKPSSVKARTVLRRGLRGRVAGGDGSGRLVAATDAAAKRRRSRRKGDVVGWGYITGRGDWGCGGTIFDGVLNPHRTGLGSLSGELRAVHMLLVDLSAAGPMTVLVDSTGALGYLRRWQAGETGAMPEGYSTRRRTGSGSTKRKPTLVRLAEMVAASPHLRFVHVAGHSGHPLNEAADSLASFARKCLAGERRGGPAAWEEHASDLADAFLRSWREQGGPIPEPNGHRSPSR
ncbi:ribonuclease HI [Thermomonospora amylolytica]|uniref:ribonuclease HI n=1 Tax=Thermomonospora amylolytica TaxID=1411117 RepID=UPI0013005D29|nr:RNase H family protein [Thermomonospora amylolytica]